MFTIRFEYHGGGYKTAQCRKYAVDPSYEGPNGAEKQVMLINDNNDGEIDARVEYEQIGPAAPFAIAWVTNDEGKTIDKIAV